MTKDMNYNMIVDCCYTIWNNNTPVNQIELTNHIFYGKSQFNCQYEKHETKPIIETIKP